MAGQLRNSGLLLDGTSRFHRAGVDLHHFLGVSCFAERTVLPEQGVVKIKPEVRFEVAALMGCSVMTGIGAVMNTAQVEPGASVLVIGAGGVGLNVVIGAVLVGANRIIVADLLDSKLELARSFGATHLINAREQDVVAAVRALTGGDGADYAFEVIGNPKTMATAYQAVRRGGTAVAVGIPPFGSEMTINAGELVYQEKTLKGSYYGTARPHADMPRLLDLYLAGRLPLDRLVSRSYPLEEVNEAYDALLAGEVARSVLLPRRLAEGGRKWSGARDLNPGPLGPEPSALPYCASPRREPEAFYVACLGAVAGSAAQPATVGLASIRVAVASATVAPSEIRSILAVA